MTDDDASIGRNDEACEKLSRLMDFLSRQTLFPGDIPSWAANCIRAYLDGAEKSLDHAFGIRSSKRGPKPMTEGRHDDWVVAAWKRVLNETPDGKDWPDTKALAEIGRYFGLGGRGNEDTEDHAIASELKRILIRYHRIIIEQLSSEQANELRDELGGPG
jgi:hypothetical protein